MNKPLLLLFLREPVKGKVKTRLAATVGDDRALRVYMRLLETALDAGRGLGCARQAWYAAPPTNDVALAFGFAAQVQSTGDLGDRMLTAFRQGFNDGFSSIVIIGSDLPSMNTELLRTALERLMTHDVVIGPATDGGYYLLGMNQLHADLFHNRSWSTSTVFEDTMKDVERLALRVALLPTLRDVDTEEDLHGTLLQ